MESIAILNRRLEETYGRYLDSRPHYRIVFSEDQFEKRWTNYTDEGFALLNPEVRELPKYRQYMQPPCYVLEKLTEIPEGPKNDLTEKLSYEPVWSFYDVNHNPVAPVWMAIQLILKSLIEQMTGVKGKIKYSDPRVEHADPKIAAEARNAEIDEMVEGLYGKEEDILHNAGHSGIVVPSNYANDSSGNQKVH